MPTRTPTTRDRSAGSASSRADLYETDFLAWTEEQAALLRSGRSDLADLANIAEEIATLGRAERASLRSAYRLVTLHLLKLIVQKSEPAGAGLAPASAAMPRALSKTIPA